MNSTPLARAEVAAPSRLASPTAALGLAGFTTCAVLGGGVLTSLTHDLHASFDGVLLAVIAVMGAVGLVVARRKSSNSIGWLLLCASSLLSLYAVAVLYTVLDYHLHSGDLPLGRVALVLEPSWVLGFMLLGAAVALFPDGRIGSANWRRALYVYIGTGVWFCTVWSVSQANLQLGPHFDVDAAGNYVGTQKGFAGLSAGVAWSAAPLMLLLLIAFVLRQAAAWRRARGERRKQLTWLMSSGAVSILSIVIVTNTNTSSGERILNDVAALGLTAVPLAIGVGILKYRLYEIDRLINRTISYALLTAMLAGVFIGIVVLMTDVLPVSSPVAVAASTLAAAALFSPLRERTQRLIDRRFNRTRYDAQATIAAFSGHLRDSIDSDAITSELIRVVEQTIAPAHVTVWITPSR